MEETKQDDVKQERKPPGVGVAYPIETVDSLLENARQLVDEYGSSRPISKEEISKTLNKKVNTLSLFFSTMVQYSVFNLVHGKGYVPSDLYRKFTEPVHDNDEYKCKLMMFKSAPLYAKIIENLNGHMLPADEKRVANLLKGEPYNVNPNSADRAARIFIENCRVLNLRDNNTGKFKFPDLQNMAKPSLIDVHTPIQAVQEKPQFSPYDDVNDELFELPIPLPNKRRAYLRYPVNDLTKKDILVITKALEFIASSLEDE